MVVIRHSGCIREKVDVLGRKRMYSGKVVVFGQRWLYSGKVDVIEQKLLYSGKSGCTRAKEVVF